MVPITSVKEDVPVVNPLLAYLITARGDILDSKGGASCLAKPSCMNSASKLAFS
jgi:hypothetical protein